MSETEVVITKTLNGYIVNKLSGYRDAATPQGSHVFNHFDADSGPSLVKHLEELFEANK